MMVERVIFKGEQLELRYMVWLWSLVFEGIVDVLLHGSFPWNNVYPPNRGVQ